jgi:hypothetical protein
MMCDRGRRTFRSRAAYPRMRFLVSIEKFEKRRKSVNGFLGISKDEMMESSCKLRWRPRDAVSPFSGKILRLFSEF